MRKGELSKRAGVPVQTRRFYARATLLQEPRRTASRRRDYGEIDLSRVRFIRASQQLGFTLREIRKLLRSSCRSATSGSIRDALLAGT